MTLALFARREQTVYYRPLVTECVQCLARKPHQHAQFKCAECGEPATQQRVVDGLSDGEFCDEHAR